MPSVIEVAKTGRAKCRGCQEAIAKDELRFGLEAPSQFGDGESLQWYHLACAAEAKPAELKPVLEAFTGELPEKQALLDSLPENERNLAMLKVQKADRAPTGRASCMQCKEPIAKGEWRIAVERELQNVGAAGMKSSGYLHPKCAMAFLQGSKDALMTRLAKKSELTEGDAKEIEAQL